METKLISPNLLADGHDRGAADRGNPKNNLANHDGKKLNRKQMHSCHKNE